MRSIKEANIVEGTIAMVRVDWNEPVERLGANPKDVKVLNTSRIEASAETINFILERGGKVIVISHLGDGTDSLEPIVEEAKRIFKKRNIYFIKDPWNQSSSDGKFAFDHLKPGEMAVFENLRFWMEKENDEAFGNRLAAFADIYVNDAFSASHRKHTSIVQLPNFLPAFAGLRFLEEYEKLSEVFHAEHPFLLILGGAKFETKLPLVEKFLKSADNIFIGGAMAKHAFDLPIASNSKIIFPAQNYEDLDANTDTLSLLIPKIKEAKFILWNGPLGNYENGYKDGTLSLARMLADSRAKVIVGGGDTITSIKELGIKDKFYFVSLAGGAMLDFLASGTLPGLEALCQKNLNGQ